MYRFPALYPNRKFCRKKDQAPSSLRIKLRTCSFNHVERKHFNLHVNSVNKIPFVFFTGLKMCQKYFLFFPQRSKRLSVATRYRFELSLSWFINVSFNKLSEKMSWKPRTNGDNFPARGDGKHKEIRYRTSREKEISCFN